VVTATTGSLSRAVDLFHALSDETRLEILDCLKDGEQCVCDLMDVLKSAQSRLSFHLRVLKDSGLILDRKEGRWMYYSINDAVFEEMDEVMSSLRRTAKNRRARKRCD